MITLSPGFSEKMYDEAIPGLTSRNPLPWSFGLKGGAAIFFSTHVLEVAEKLCNKIAIIKEGRLVASGDTESVIGGDSSLEELFLELNADE